MPLAKHTRIIEITSWEVGKVEMFDRRKANRDPALESYCPALQENPGLREQRLNHLWTHN